MWGYSFVLETLLQLDSWEKRRLGETDRRKLRRLAPHQDVYRQWLTYWRRKIASKEIESVIKADHGEFPCK